MFSIQDVSAVCDWKWFTGIKISTCSTTRRKQTTKEERCKYKKHWNIL